MSVDSYENNLYIEGMQDYGWDGSSYDASGNTDTLVILLVFRVCSSFGRSINYIPDGASSPGF